LAGAVARKALEDANIKLTSLISDIAGVSGRRILKAIVAGETNAEKLAALGSRRLRCSRSELIAALEGHVSDNHRFLIGQHLGMLEDLERRIEAFDKRIADVLGPFCHLVALLMTIPGVSRVSAEIILAEIGFDMTPFPTAGHLLSWAGMIPRLDESAGKRRSTRIRHGAPWLKPVVLTQCGWAASRSRGTYLQAQCFRLRARRGPKKAVIAVTASILTAVYHMLKNHVPYQDLGPDYFVKRDPTRIAAKLTQRIKDLGYDVQYSAAA
jgi:transposase